MMPRRTTALAARGYDRAAMATLHVLRVFVDDDGRGGSGRTDVVEARDGAG
jgi:hypothetical protein